MITPYEYQLDTVAKTVSTIVNAHARNEAALMKLIANTGAGKSLMSYMTWCEYAATKKYPGVTVIGSPRIGLGHQLMNDFMDYQREYKDVQFLPIIFNSGKFTVRDDNEDFTIDFDNMSIKYTDRIVSTTNIEALKAEIQRGKDMGVEVVISACYDSGAKLVGSGIEIDMIIADEAHNIVSDKAFYIAEELEAKVKLFMTATSRITQSSDGRGMNNVLLYGETIANITQAHTVPVGACLPARLHICDLQERKMSSSRNKTVCGALIECFRVHKEQVSNRLPEGKTVPVKMLVATEGSKQLKYLLDQSRLSGPCKADVYAASSTFDGKTSYRINSRHVDNADFYRELRSTEKDCLILHYDMIGEGISIDGITGVVPLRKLNLTKFIQLVGRAMRPLRDDRIAFRDFYNKTGGYSQQDDQCLKPYAWVIVPLIEFKDEDNEAFVKTIMSEMRSKGIHYLPEETVTEAISLGDTEEDEEAEIGFTETKEKENNMLNLDLFQWEHDIEEEYMTKIHMSDINEEDFLAM